MNKLKNFSITKCSYFQLFILIELCVVSLFTIYNYWKNGSPLNSLMLSANYACDDYFMHIGYASSPWGTNIYEYSTNVCFPPLAYLMYGFLARIAGYSAIDPIDITSHEHVGQNITIYVVYSIICIVLCLYAISLYLKKKGFINQVLFPCLLIVSYPFAFSSIQRGNSVLLVAVLMSIALIWKDDSSKTKREFAMIIIAICAGLKIYPALLGIFYIKEKRFKETIRLIIYGIVLFFVPFLFFDGFNGVRTFFNNAFYLNGVIHKCSVSGLIREITELLGIYNPTLIFVGQQSFLLISILSFFLCKEKWGEILILCTVMAVYISSSWMYTCVYILPALLMFFYEKETKPIRINKTNFGDILGFLLFLISFSIPYKLNYPFVYAAIIAFDSLYMINVFVVFIMKSVKKKKSIVCR